MNILALSGSLRQASLNQKMLAAALRLAPKSAKIEAYDYRDLPLYDQDLDNENAPSAVHRWKSALKATDAVLIATPEYNYGLPGPLKNALDWGSRPAYKSPFAGLPVGIMSASMSPVGGVRAQAHLKQVLLGMLASVYPAPELAWGQAQSRFDADGELASDTDRAQLERYVTGFVDFARRQTRA